MTGSIVAVAVALIGGPVTAWITTRGAVRKAADAQVAAEAVQRSIGPVNGHGTVQDATGEILDRMAALERQVERGQHQMAVAVESVVTGASTVTDRLKAHDREFMSVNRRIDALEVSQEEP